MRFAYPCVLVCAVATGARWSVEPTGRISLMQVRDLKPSGVAGTTYTCAAPFEAQGSLYGTRDGMERLKGRPPQEQREKPEGPS